MPRDEEKLDGREIDRLAREEGNTRSEWQERTAPTANDPVSDDGRKGLDVLGQSDPRGDGAKWGVGDRNEGDVGAAEPADGSA